MSEEIIYGIVRDVKNSGTYGKIFGVVHEKNGKTTSFTRHIGRLVDGEKNVFYSKKYGLRIYDSEKKEVRDLRTTDQVSLKMDQFGKPSNSPKNYTFGDCIFLDNLLKEIGIWDLVDSSIIYGNMDTVKAYLFYKILDGGPSDKAEIWFRNSIASKLFPNANMAGQRISDMLKALGNPEQKQKYLKVHIEYIKNKANSSCQRGSADSVLIENKCDISKTAVSVHNNKTEIGFRLFTVVEEVFGLPIYYDIVPGSMNDSENIERASYILDVHGCKITFFRLDSAFSAPSVRDRLAFLDINYLTRLNNGYNEFKKAYDKYNGELNKRENLIKFKDRFIYIVKIPSCIGYDPNTNEPIMGNIYLCKDADKNTALLQSLTKKGKSRLTTEEYENARNRLGVFALVTTEDYTIEDVISEYYKRQEIEQMHDYLKNTVKAKTVRLHNELTIAGDTLISFLATTIIILIRHRLNITAFNYVMKPRGENDELEYDDDSILSIIEQKSNCKISKESIPTVLKLLAEMRCDVFVDRIIPDTARKEVKDIFEAFGLGIPNIIYIKENGELSYQYNRFKNTGKTKDLTFSLKTYLTDEEIIKMRNKDKNKNNNINNEEQTSEKSDLVSENKDQKRRIKNKENNGDINREVSSQKDKNCVKEKDCSGQDGSEVIVRKAKKDPDLSSAREPEMRDNQSKSSQHNEQTTLSQCIDDHVIPYNNDHVGKNGKDNDFKSNESNSNIETNQKHINDNKCYLDISEKEKKSQHMSHSESKQIDKSDIKYSCPQYDHIRKMNNDSNIGNNDMHGTVNVTVQNGSISSDGCSTIMQSSIDKNINSDKYHKNNESIPYKNQDCNRQQDINSIVNTDMNLFQNYSNPNYCRINSKYIDDQTSAFYHSMIDCMQNAYTLGYETAINQMRCGNIQSSPQNVLNLSEITNNIAIMISNLVHRFSQNIRNSCEYTTSHNYIYIQNKSFYKNEDLYQQHISQQINHGFEQSRKLNELNHNNYVGYNNKSCDFKKDKQSENKFNNYRLNNKRKGCDMELNRIDRGYNKKEQFSTDYYNKNSQIRRPNYTSNDAFDQHNSTNMNLFENNNMHYNSYCHDQKYSRLYPPTVYEDEYC